MELLQVTILVLKLNVMYLIKAHNEKFSSNFYFASTKQ